MILTAYAMFVAVTPLVVPPPKVNGLESRQSSLRELLKNKIDDASAWNELGLVCVALGELSEAEEAFTQRIRWANAKGESRTHALKSLTDSLAQQRALFTLESSLAAAHNNRGATRLLRGDLVAAQEDLDKAATLQPEWAPPWTNGALLWLEKNNTQKAIDTAINARSLGGESPQTLTILGEGALRRQQWETARAMLQRAQEIQPNYPYSLLVRAMLDEAQGHGREAERLRMQALALLAQTATKGKAIPKLRENQLTLGLGERFQARTLNQGASDRTFTSRELRVDHEAVEGRSNAKQTSLRWQSMLGTTQPLGSQGVFTRLVHEEGQRPGRIGEKATYQRERYATFSLLKRREISNGVLLTAITPRFNQLPTLKDTQLGADVRVDRANGLGRELTMGAAWLYNQRTGYQPRNKNGLPAPAEPNDQLLGAGATQLGTVYAILTGQPAPGRLWRLGPVIGWQESALASLPTRSTYGGLLNSEKRHSVNVLPYAEWLSPLRRNQHLHLALRPRLNPACGELMPTYLLGTPLYSLPGGKTLITTNDRLLDLFLPGPQGKRWDAEANFTQTNRHISWQATLFQRNLEKGYLLTEDPRLTSTLLFQPISRAKTTGLSLQSNLSRSGMGWESALTYQQSGSLGLPAWDAHLRLDSSIGKSLGRYFGEIRYAYARNSINGYVTGGYNGYVTGGFSSSTAVTILRLGGEIPLATKGAAHFQLQTPVGGSNAFFTGYPVGTQLVFGIQQPF